MKISGQVVKGNGIGKKLGFPTLNIPYSGDVRGVFAGKVLIAGKVYGAAVNVGDKPTIGDKKAVCEVHLLDFSGIFAGNFLEVELIKKIRDTKKFDDLNSLKDQISEDVKECAKVLSIRV